jgi:hypothetical protein
VVTVEVLAVGQQEHTGEQSGRVEPDTSVSGDQKMFSAEEATDLDTEVDSWAEVMAAAEMAANTASRDARAGAVKSENPLFEPVDTEDSRRLQRR